jgi:ABC-type methionine transport system ATPase subunit
MIELTDIHKAFNQGRENEYWALDGIDLHIAGAEGHGAFAARAARARPRC